MPLATPEPRAPSVPPPGGRESLLAVMADAAPSMIAYVDADERYRLCNAACVRGLGPDPVGRTVRDVLGDAAYERLRPYVRQVLAGTRVTFESELPRPDGAHRIVEAIYTPDLGPDGRVRGFVAVMADVSERRAAQRDREALLSRTVLSEEQLRASGERLRLALRGAGAGAWELDLRTGDSVWSPEMQAVVGTPAGVETFTLEGFVDLIHPEDRDRVLAVLEGVASRGGAFDVEMRVVRPDDGRVVWIASVGDVVVDEAGRPTVARGINQDVTRRRAAEEALRRQEERRELLARVSEVLAAPLDVRETSKEIAALFVPRHAPWARVELAVEDAGQQAIDAPPGRTAPPDEVIAVPMVHLGRTVGTLRLGARREDLDDGTLATIGEVASRAAAGLENARLFEMAQAERRRADEANRAKDEFLAVVSHELRTPLNAILGWARMLSEGQLGEAQVARATAVIERNARAQAQLIDDLLDHARIISGKLRLEVEPFDPAAVVDAATEAVTPTARTKGITLEVDAPRGGRLEGDPARVQQAVWNLLTNAVKFTPPGGRVVARLRRAVGAWIVEVEDTGPGIAADFLPHVFDRFRQADMGSRRVHGGLGLGLAIVRQIAELHGGRASAHSDGAGRGAVFRLELPVDRAAEPAAVLPPTRAAAPAARRLDGLDVLVLDDDGDACELVAALLARCGARPSVASSALEALELLDAHRFHVIVSDLGMPEVDGIDFIERVRARSVEQGGRTPALALTAYVRGEDRDRALLAGFHAHVAKPVDFDQLVRVVGELAARG